MSEKLDEILTRHFERELLKAENKRVEGEQSAKNCKKVLEMLRKRRRGDTV